MNNNKKMQEKKLKKVSQKKHQEPEELDEGWFGDKWDQLKNWAKSRKNIDPNVATILLYVIAEVHNSPYSQPRNVRRLPFAYAKFHQMYVDFKNQLSLYDKSKSPLKSFHQTFGRLGFVSPQKIKLALNTLLKHYDYAIKKHKEENFERTDSTLYSRERGEAGVEPGERTELGESLKLQFKTSRKGVFKLLMEAEGAETRTAEEAPPVILIKREEYKNILLHFFETLGYDFRIGPEVPIPEAGSKYEPEPTLEGFADPDVYGREVASVRGRSDGERYDTRPGDMPARTAPADARPETPSGEGGSTERGGPETPAPARTGREDAYAALDRFMSVDDKGALVLKPGAVTKIAGRFYMITDDGSPVEAVWDEAKGDFVASSAERS